MLNACENAAWRPDGRNQQEPGDSMKRRFWIAALLLPAVAGCSTFSDLWRGGPRELSRARPDVLELHCAGGRTLALRMEPASRAAWIILPDREFRLDAVAGDPARYSNGRTTLLDKGGEMSLEEGGVASVSGCRRG
jgi:hypothetical protein